MVYPKPGLLTDILVIVPPAPIVAVAVAVVPTPTPISGGADNLTTGAVAYPEPKLEVLNPVTVPATETVAVASAFTKLN